jgi:hypothetical protein
MELQPRIQNSSENSFSENSCLIEGGAVITFSCVISSVRKMLVFSVGGLILGFASFSMIVLFANLASYQRF